MLLLICNWIYVRTCPSPFPSCHPGLWDPWHYSGTGLLRVLDHRQVSQLVVIAPVTVLSSTCSPTKRTGAKWPPVWPLHSTCKRWIYFWKALTSTSYSCVCPVLATASLCRNWVWIAVHQVSSQGGQHTLAYTPTLTHAQTPHTWTYHAYHMPTRQVRACSFNQSTPITHATVFLYACPHYKILEWTHTTFSHLPP